MCAYNNDRSKHKLNKWGDVMDFDNKDEQIKDASQKSGNDSKINEDLEKSLKDLGQSVECRITEFLEKIFRQPPKTSCVL